MRYPGGKGKTFQHVINLMPPHSVYVETHLGGGAVMRNKRPAKVSIGIDLDERALQAWKSNPGGDCSADVRLVHGRAEDFLCTYDFTGAELIYVDAPYHPATRRQQRVYRHDYAPEDHECLLALLVQLPCKVLVSGYPHGLYDAMLTGWNVRSFRAKTHADVREEKLWFNYEPPQVLHDDRYLGADFRDRQSIKRRMDRLKQKVEAMEPRERAAFASWLHTHYPPTESRT